MSQLMVASHCVEETIVQGFGVIINVCAEVGTGVFVTPAVTKGQQSALQVLQLSFALHTLFPQGSGVGEA